MHKKLGAISQLGAEIFTFPHKRAIRTDGYTDICFYRVASLLKMAKADNFLINSFQGGNENGKFI